MDNESGDGDQAAIPRQGQEVAGSGAPAEDVAMSRPKPRYHFSETDDYMMLVAGSGAPVEDVAMSRSITSRKLMIT